MSKAAPPGLSIEKEVDRLLVNRVVPASILVNDALENDDMVNLLGNVSIPVVMVGDDLRIRRFTPLVEKLMNFAPPICASSKSGPIW